MSTRTFAVAVWLAAAALPVVAQDQHAGHASSDDMQGMDMSGMQMDGMDHGVAKPAAMKPSVKNTDVHTPEPNGHVPPPPPVHPMPAMPPAQMAKIMQMDDQAVLGMFKAERLERTQGTDGRAGGDWEAEGWLGNDSGKLWVKTEGEREDGATRDARVELLWDRPLAAFWDGQLGLRHDFGQGPSRQWAAFGVQGLAPYWFELQATAYAGPDGRTAARVEASYELLFTQRLVLAPELEVNAYGKDDPRRGLGRGLADAELGLRLRYEFNRHVAPYLGVVRAQRYGRSADAARALGWRPGDTRWVAGLRIWF
jgi:copper resistance protein B